MQLQVKLQTAVEIMYFEANKEQTRKQLTCFEVWK